MTSVNVHATCVALARAADIFGGAHEGAVLLLGESGSGKSRIALQMISRGAILVADDRVELFARGRHLWARPPPRLAGLFEARGVGIVKLPYADEARVVLAVSLAAAPQRYPEHVVYAPPEALAIREPPALFRLAADDAAVCDKIFLAAAAVSNALFREEGNSH